MAEPLRPDGVALPIGDVVLYTPGLAGTVEVHGPGTAGMRAAEDASPAFLKSLADNGFQEQLSVEIADPVELDGAGGTRAAGGGSDIQLEAPAPGDGFGQLLLYAAEDGSLSWHLPEDVPRDQVATRGGERRRYRVPRAVVPAGAPGQQRGVTGIVAKKLLKLLAFPLMDRWLGKIGEDCARKWEDGHRQNRVRAFDAGSYRDPQGAVLTPEDLGRLGAAGPVLLFVHGTLSQAHTAFGTLPEALVAELTERYGGRVVAFDHPTISVTPTENARTLASLVPATARLTVDVVAHSRGGLVSRVLSERGGDVGLGDRLAVRTLVMVATPNAGTALAQRDHLGKLIDRFTNILQFVPDNAVTDTLDAVLTVLKQLALGIFGGLEGLAAMDPGGSYLRELNGPGPARAGYHAVAANYEPPADSPLLRVARDGLTDLVFGRAENDLVVPTKGVFTVPGAGGFPVADPLVFDAARGVDHSGFWRQPELAAALREWLS